MLSLVALSCATVPPPALPDKYNLDDELESVDQISTFRVPRWQNVDKQSIILRDRSQ